MHKYAYATVLLLVGGTVVYLLFSGDIGGKEIGTSFLAFVGTFLGALLAFRLNENKELRKLEKERKASINRALFVLLRQRNAINVLAKAIEPYKSDLERAFNCPALQPPTYSDLKQDFAALDFLLESPEPNLLMLLSVEEEGFHQTLESLRIRNECYVREVQPFMAQRGLNKKTFHPGELEAAFDERLFGSAMNYSKYMYENVTEASKNLPVLHNNLFSLAKKLFPEGNFIRPIAS